MISTSETPNINQNNHNLNHNHTTLPNIRALDKSTYQCEDCGYIITNLASTDNSLQNSQNLSNSHNIITCHTMMKQRINRLQSDFFQVNQALADEKNKNNYLSVILESLKSNLTQSQNKENKMAEKYKVLKKKYREIKDQFNDKLFEKIAELEKNHKVEMETLGELLAISNEKVIKLEKEKIIEKEKEKTEKKNLTIMDSTIQPTTCMGTFFSSKPSNNIRERSKSIQKPAFPLPKFKETFLTPPRIQKILEKNDKSAPNSAKKNQFWSKFRPKRRSSSTFNKKFEFKPEITPVAASNVVPKNNYLNTNFDIQEIADIKFLVQRSDNQGDQIDQNRKQEQDFEKSRAENSVEIYENQTFRISDNYFESFDIRNMNFREAIGCSTKIGNFTDNVTQNDQNNEENENGDDSGNPKSNESSRTNSKSKLEFDKTPILEAIAERKSSGESDSDSSDSSSIHLRTSLVKNLESKNIMAQDNPTGLKRTKAALSNMIHVLNQNLEENERVGGTSSSAGLNCPKAKRKRICQNRQFIRKRREKERPQNTNDNNTTLFHNTLNPENSLIVNATKTLKKRRATLLQKSKEKKSSIPINFNFNSIENQHAEAKRLGGNVQQDEKVAVVKKSLFSFEKMSQKIANDDQKIDRPSTQKIRARTEEITETVFGLTINDRIHKSAILHDISGISLSE